jgi:hypothetical protein
VTMTTSVTILRRMAPQYVTGAMFENRLIRFGGQRALSLLSGSTGLRLGKLPFSRWRGMGQPGLLRSSGEMRR